MSIYEMKVASSTDSDAQPLVAALEHPAVATVLGIDTHRVRVTLIDGADTEAYEDALESDPAVLGYRRIYVETAQCKALVDAVAEAIWDSDAGAYRTAVDVPSIADDGQELYDAACAEHVGRLRAALPGWAVSWDGTGNTDAEGGNTEDLTLTPPESIDTQREPDGRWLAYIAGQPGVMAYGETRDAAIGALNAD